MADSNPEIPNTERRTEKVFLIDGNSYVYRAFFATPHLSNSKGIPTNAVYAFLSMIKKLISEKEPDRLVVIFDSKAPSFREEISREYKAQRPPMPGNMAVQFPFIKDLVEAMGIPVVEKEGYEADDIIATIVDRLRSAGREIYIVTGDKDMAQLITDSVFVYDAQKNLVLDGEEATKKYGLLPSQMRDYLSLAGDTSDNIPGVPGIGDKTARELIGQFGSFDDIYNNLEAVRKQSVREKLVYGRGLAEMSRRLATLVHDIPVGDIEEITKKRTEDTGTLRRLLRDLEFTSLYREIAGEGETRREYRRCGPDEIDPFRVSVAAHFQGRNAGDFQLDGFAVYDGTHVCASREAGELVRILARAKTVITHNLKPLYAFARSQGATVPADVFDTMLAAYLVNPLRKDFSIDSVLDELLDVQVSAGDMQEILVERALYLFDLQETFLAALNDRELKNLYYDIELPLVEVLADMEFRGVRVDRKMLQALSRDFDQRLTAIAREIYALSGQPFNINSPQQLSRILFETLGLQPVKKTKTGFSTDTEVLQILAEKHPLPQKILDYRTLAKLKSTYIDVLPTLINHRTGRIHTTYNQMVVATGRLSCSDPNLQNIPIRGEEGRKIREAFIAGDGNLLLSSDYSQIELRVLAHFSKDPLLIETFARDEDIHTRVAADVFRVDPDLVTHDMRRAAKVINFGIIYGMSGFGLAKELGVPQKEAQRYIDDYFAKHQGVKAFMDGVIEDTRERGYVRTLSGRMRFIPELNNSDNTVRQLGERAAMNTPIQGTAADIIKIAMISIYRRIGREGLLSKLIMQIHDELVLEVVEGELETISCLVAEEMENAIVLSVPLKVSIGSGKNWATAHD